MARGRRRAIGAAIVALAAVMTLLVLFRRPFVLALSTERIEVHLLRKLPPQTPKREVLEFARRNDITVSADVRTTQDRFLRLHLGHYRVVFRTDVVAFVWLDDKDRVVRIDVEKHTDSF